MASNIVPPFKIWDDGITIQIEDANGFPLLTVEQYTKDETAFARELCTIMNENHKRLCHAANGEGDDSHPVSAEEAESGKTQWCAACATECSRRGVDLLVICKQYTDKANGDGEASNENTTTKEEN